MKHLGETITLPEELYPLISALIRERLGLDYSPEKRIVLQDRLYPILVEENMSGFIELYYALKYSEDQERLWKRVQSALAVRETYFWREVDQILAAAQVLIPQMQKDHPDRAIRVWHAACSSGEEPYSLLIACMENSQQINWDRLEIIGTDFDIKALEIAQKGVFGLRSFRVLPSELRDKYFVKVDDHRYQLIQPLIGKVKFQYLNLADDLAMSAMQEFDIIFCRNAFIYFDVPSVTRVAQHFYRALHNPGYLFLGAAESLLRISTSFELREIQRAFVYVKEEKDPKQAGI